MATTIEDYLVLDIGALRRGGFFQRGCDFSGEVRFRQGDEQVGRIGLASIMSASEPYALLWYTCNGESVREKIRVEWRRSNLSPDSQHGYYYFICPATGERCRKLYLHGSRFVSRKAFRPLYQQQALSKRGRAGNVWLTYVLKVASLTEQRYRKETYRDRLTPYGRKLLRLLERREDVGTEAKRELDRWRAMY